MGGDLLAQDTQNSVPRDSECSLFGFLLSTLSSRGTDEPRGTQLSPRPAPQVHVGCRVSGLVAKS